MTNGALSNAVEIGKRARAIRLRRDLDQSVVAGRIGCSQAYLSMLENGRRGFTKRGLLDDLADALGCSVVDLTGQPYIPVDRATANALATLPDIRLALNDYQPDEIPTRLTRPLDQLAALVDDSSSARDQANYSVAGRGLGRILEELQTHVLTSSGESRTGALRSLLEGWVVAAAIASNFGYIDLAIQASQRAEYHATSLGSPWALGFTRWYLAHGLMRASARQRAAEKLTDAIDDLAPNVYLRANDTTAAQMLGLLHLTSAQTAARSKSSDVAHGHLAEASFIAERIGEHNALRRHFGPTNVASWILAVGNELNEGGRAYSDAMAMSLDFGALGSDERVGALHLELARALLQEEGREDTKATRHLDAADVAAPQLIRPNPLAREALLELTSRAGRGRTWELDSLRNRFGMK